MCIQRFTEIQNLKIDRTLGIAIFVLDSPQVSSGRASHRQNPAVGGIAAVVPRLPKLLGEHHEQGHLLRGGEKPFSFL